MLFFEVGNFMEKKDWFSDFISIEFFKSHWMILFGIWIILLEVALSLGLETYFKTIKDCKIETYIENTNFCFDVPTYIINGFLFFLAALCFVYSCSKFKNNNDPNNIICRWNF